MAASYESSEFRVTTEAAAKPDWLLYLTKFLSIGAPIGSLSQSSRWVARRILQGIDFDRAECVVELGAGTGPITRELLARAAGRCRALIVEWDADFCERLRGHFPGAEIVQGNAFHLDRHLQERGIRRVDHVLCELGVGWFPDEDRRRLLTTVCERLASGGTYRQLAHLPWYHAREYQRYFREVKPSLVLRNAPPAWCYVCRDPLPQPMDAT